MNKRAILCIFIIISAARSHAQEVITGLQSSFRIREAWEKLEKRKGIAAPDTLELPFFDDFSKPTIFPDNTKWQDNFVFINNTYSIDQKTEGIATFDAIDNTGRLYETASSSGFEADHLTSKPVNLNYSSSSGIYLSFFYQAGGLADVPEKKDSLTLQFLAPAENLWYSVWKADSTAVHPFKPVIIKIDNPKFLIKGFRFRFINYASLGSSLLDPSMIGNGDQWNIDYVLLDKNRNGADTSAADVAFTLPVRSILKTYEAMPWKQFRQVFLSEMGPSIQVMYRNNDKIVRNITRNFEIMDMYKNIQVHSFSSGAININPFTDITYKAGLIYTFNSNFTDSALFRVKCILVTDDFDRKNNDTITYYQRFGNYFAFDDGSSESGYGINGLGSRNAMVAYRFKSFIPDSIRAIQICFNDSYQNANLRAFDLMIWDDNNGIPGNNIYAQPEMIVKQGEGINGFYPYILNNPVFVDGNFYVGWKQRSETFLNAGFDLNTPNAGRQFYWLNGNWSQSQASGSIMIRPVTGNPVKTTSIPDIPDNKKNIKIWPNPARDIINIDAADLLLSGSSPIIKIFDIQGRELMQTAYNERIDISKLREGLYLIALIIDGRPVSYKRFVKTR
jgi:hypothetical protein